MWGRARWRIFTQPRSSREDQDVGSSRFSSGRRGKQESRLQRDTYILAIKAKYVSFSCRCRTVRLQSGRFVDSVSDTVSPDNILTHTDRFELPSPTEQVMLRRELSSVCGEQADVVLIVELSARRAFASVCGVEHISRNRQTACPDEAMRSRVDCCTRHLRGVN